MNQQFSFGNVFQCLGIVFASSIFSPIASSEGLSTVSVAEDFQQDFSNAIVIPLEQNVGMQEEKSNQANAAPTIPIPLRNVTSYIMDGTTTEVISTSQQKTYNMRIKSDQTALTDYLQITYGFNKSDQKFVPIQILKYINIGTYSPPYFAKDVTPLEITMKSGSNTLVMGQAYTVASTVSSVFTMDLKAGHVISFLLSNQTDGYRFKVINPFGEIVQEFLGASDTSVISIAVPILANGIYKIKFEPINYGSVSLSLKFLNANRRNIFTVTNNTLISDSFATNLRDYSKYAIDLRQGEIFTATRPSNSDIELRLIDSRNARVAYVRGLPLLHQAKTTGRYYLFIDNSRGWSSRYNGRVNIQQPLATASLRFDNSTGPVSKTIVRNSGAPVVFSWKTSNVPSGTTCRIYLRPNDTYAAAATPVSAGTLTSATINSWSTGTRLFYLGCSDGTASPNITLNIQ